MSFLNPPYENGFKELCASMPLFYLDVFEMREILKAQGWLLDNLRGGIELIVDDNFIMTADETTIKRWEDAIGIIYDKSLTLDQRKIVIIGHICGFGHIGEPEIRQIVGLYTDAGMALWFKKGIIYLIIDDDEIFDENNLLKTLLQRIPAHLKLVMCVHNNRHFEEELDMATGAYTHSHITSKFIE